MTWVLREAAERLYMLRLRNQELVVCTHLRKFGSESSNASEDKMHERLPVASSRYISELSIRSPPVTQG